MAEGNIFEQGCLIQLNVSIWGGRIKLPSTKLNVDADPTLIKAIKYLIDRDCLKPIEKERNAARTYVYGKTLPFPIPGVHFIPKDLIQPVDRTLPEYQARFNEKISHFANNFEIFIQSARLRLNQLFDPSEYPTDIRSKFSFSWRFLVVDSPGKTGILTPEIYAREEEKFQRTMDEFNELAIVTLRTRFAEMIDRAVNRLSGEKKTFRDSLIGNIREFLDDFSQLNIRNDQELEEQVARCRLILEGVDPVTLRSDDGFRQEIARKMTSVQQQIDAMMVDRPKRKIRIIPEAQGAMA